MKKKFQYIFLNIIVHLILMKIDISSQLCQIYGGPVVHNTTKSPQHNAQDSFCCVAACFCCVVLILLC